jgi:MFS family permease
MSLLTKPLKILLATDGLVMVASSMLIPFFAVFVEKVGGDILEIGFAASLFAIAGGVAVLLAGRLADKVRRKERMIAVAYMVLAAGFALYLAVDNIWLLLVVQVVVGLAEASYYPAFDALYGEHAHEGGSHAARRWSLTEANDYFAAAIGAALGAGLVHYVGFDALFITMSLFCLASGIYLFLTPARAFAPVPEEKG